ncbi:hypothetical protein ACT048_04850 [Ectopseudomonas khazarica]|uniref:hypothetical protein n=1 Tax=Ectopseudomonas khazarica TaxID=2502979 RepID=UPI004033C49E
MRSAIIAASAALSLSGCASIFSEQTYPVQVTSEPSRASIEIKDEDGNVVYNGSTPATVKLTSSAGYFDGERYTVTFRKDGYDEEQFVINSGIDGWYWGNILLGGIMGMLIIDPATGAMYDLPSKAGATLKPSVDMAAPSQPANVSDQGMSKGQWQQQQLQQLRSEKGLPYEEYQRRYRQIMSQ